MATRPRVRVGIVGAGFVAHIHGLAYRHVRGVDVELTCVTATPGSPEESSSGLSSYQCDGRNFR